MVQPQDEASALADRVIHSIQRDAALSFTKPAEQNLRDRVQEAYHTAEDAGRLDELSPAIGQVIEVVGVKARTQFVGGIEREDGTKATGKPVDNVAIIEAFGRLCPIFPFC